MDKLLEELIQKVVRDEVTKALQKHFNTTPIVQNAESDILPVAKALQSARKQKNTTTQASKLENLRRSSRIGTRSNSSCEKWEEKTPKRSSRKSVKDDSDEEFGNIKLALGETRPRNASKRSSRKTSQSFPDSRRNTYLRKYSTPNTTVTPQKNTTESSSQNVLISFPSQRSIGSRKRRVPDNEYEPIADDEYEIMNKPIDDDSEDEYDLSFVNDESEDEIEDSDNDVKVISDEEVQELIRLKDLKMYNKDSSSLHMRNNDQIEDDLEPYFGSVNGSPITEKELWSKQSRSEFFPHYCSLRQISRVYGFGFTRSELREIAKEISESYYLKYRERPARVIYNEEKKEWREDLKKGLDYYPPDDNDWIVDELGAHWNALTGKKIKKY